MPKTSVRLDLAVDAIEWICGRELDAAPGRERDVFPAGSATLGAKNSLIMRGRPVLARISHAV
jgi:hypothetical protein